MVDADEVRVGCPWSILPIKNNKYASELVDVDLADR